MTQAIIVSTARTPIGKAYRASLSWLGGMGLLIRAVAVIVVMNKPGGTGSIAAQFVKAAPHDGYTVLIGTGSQMSVLPALKSNTPFDAERDFAAISLLGTT